LNETEQELIEKNIRRATGIHALRKIGTIVAEEQQADNERTSVLRQFARYGWIAMLCVALLFAYFTGVI
jgi:hypothetical protein